MHLRPLSPETPGKSKVLRLAEKVEFSEDYHNKIRSTYMVTRLA